MEIMPFPAFPQKMSSSTKLQDQSSAPKYSNGSSARSNPSNAERLPTAPFHRVTLTDIAADAGVSRATVSLVLRNSMSQLLAERRQPTAALCFNDMVVIGALRAWVNNGKSPGEDFAIIGFDDVVEAALYRPALRTVATVPGKIGEAFAELLLERISNPDRPTRRLIFKPELIVRASCGRVSANQKDHS